MWGKNLLFYFVASTIIALVFQAQGAGFGLVLFASFIGPAVILLTVQILRHNGWL